MVRESEDSRGEWVEELWCRSLVTTKWVRSQTVCEKRQLKHSGTSNLAESLLMNHVQIQYAASSVARSSCFVVIGTTDLDDVVKEIHFAFSPSGNQRSTLYVGLKREVAFLEAWGQNLQDHKACGRALASLQHQPRHLRQ